MDHLDHTAAGNRSRLRLSVHNFWPKGGGGGRPFIELAWLTYVGPRYAHLVAPPPAAIVEPQPDGGLLLAATKETFSVNNPAHMEVVRAIEAARDAFNAFTLAERNEVIAKGYN